MCINECAYILFVCSLILHAKCAEVLKIKHPYGNLVRPVVLHGRTKRELSTTRHEKNIHVNELLVTLNIEGEQYNLELTLNQGLLPEGHTISYQEGGRTVLRRPKKEEVDFCQYSGHIRGKPNSWVALATCRGLSGAIYDGSNIRYIKPADGSDIQSLHYVYEKNDLKAMHKCGIDDQDPAGTYKLTLTNNTRRTRNKRDTMFLIRGAPYRYNERSRYVELAVVADYAQYLGANKNLHILHRQLQETVNIVNALYLPLNIFVALTGVEVWTEGNRIRLDKNSTKMLETFMLYRQKSLFKNLGHHDHAHLITSTKFHDGVVGKAYISNMCSYQLSGAIIHQPSDIGAKVIARTANTMAHEMGHNLGMEHDNVDCSCRDKHCIMHPSLSRPLATHWSECSFKALAFSFSKGIDHCLRNKPDSLFGAPSCGNGFVDPGEECDCGVTMNNETRACHACCDPEICMFKSGAKCATGTCCNLKTCQLKSAGVVCRAAQRECDLPEYCSGKSEFCPEDVFKMDTTPCSDKAYCINGWCRSHDSQCQLLWGITGKSGPQKCYNRNMLGDFIDNCGYDLQNRTISKCPKNEVVCGRLQCLTYNNHLEFGVGLIRSYSVWVNSKLKRCQSTRIDFGLNVDPGMVPDGASCGDGRMCFNQRCLPIDALRRQVNPHRSEGCLTNCSSNGVCNSRGECHCDDGFAPPLCDAPGVGGSEVSCPAADPIVQEIFKLVMFIIFLGIIPFIVIILFLIYCIKNKPEQSKIHLTSNFITSVKKAVVNPFAKEKVKITNPNIVQKINKEDIKIVTNNEVNDTISRSVSYISNLYINGNVIQNTEVKLNNKDITVHAIPIRYRIENALYTKPIKLISKVQPNKITTTSMETPQHIFGNEIKSYKRAVTKQNVEKSNEAVYYSNIVKVDLPPKKNSKYNNGNIRRPVLNKDGNLTSQSKIASLENASLTKKVIKSRKMETLYFDSNTLPKHGTVKNMKSYFERHNV